MARINTPPERHGSRSERYVGGSNGGRHAPLVVCLALASVLSCRGRTGAPDHAQRSPRVHQAQGQTSPGPSAQDGQARRSAPDAAVPALGAMLGPDAVQIVEGATLVEAARLRLVSAEEQERTALRSDGRMAGYPIAGPRVVLPGADVSGLKRLLLDHQSYAWGLRIRCANSHFVGVRFVRQRQKVELALGLPCQQALWAFPAAGAVGRGGAHLGNSQTQEVLHHLTPVICPAGAADKRSWCSLLDSRGL